MGLFLGGFVFVGPFIVVAALMLFSAGFLRGARPGSAWAKAVSLTAAFWLVIVVRGDIHTDWRGMLLGLLITILPTVGGVYTRRYRIKSKANR